MNVKLRVNLHALFSLCIIVSSILSVCLWLIWFSTVLLYNLSLFRKYVLTIIRRIGLGLLLMTLAHLLFAIVELVDVILSQTSADNVCIFDDAVLIECPTSHQLLAMIHSELVWSLGAIVAAWGMIELIIAQTPHEIEGLVLSLCDTIALSL